MEETFYRLTGGGEDRSASNGAASPGSGPAPTPTEAPAAAGEETV